MGLTLALVPTLAKRAAGFGLEAKPDARRRHQGVIPVIGGLALTLGSLTVLSASTPWVRWVQSFPWWFVVAVGAMLASGAIDDARELAARTKALHQIAIALALAASGEFRVTSLGAVFGAGPVELGLLAVPFTVLVLVGYLNALNMIDGIDGLAGGVALVQLAFLALAASDHHASGAFVVLLAFGGGIAGFLAFNLPVPWRRGATVYLGDAGTQAVGLVLGCCAMAISAGSQRAGIQPMGVAWILALPVMDTLAVMLQRMISGRSPLAGDRMHLHHILTDLGLRPSSATYVLMAASGAYGAFGFIACRLGVQDWVLFFVFLLVLLWHTSFVFAARSALSRVDGLRPGTQSHAGHALSVSAPPAPDMGAL
jgi:UDP-GlcNAc:undecaprenyl-phosphate GlcNAc-1-phosphate transferase